MKLAELRKIANAILAARGDVEFASRVFIVSNTVTDNAGVNVDIDGNTYTICYRNTGLIDRDDKPIFESENGSLFVVDEVQKGALVYLEPPSLWPL